MAGRVVVRALGATVAIPAQLAELFSDLPITDAPADAAVSSPDAPVAVAELTRAAVDHSPLLCIHAGVVSAPEGLITVPGESGMGKTTLVAALVRAGFGYVSDEALAVDRASGDVTAFARPLALRGDVWPLLGLAPAPPPDVERLVVPHLLGRVDTAGGRVRHVVLARREPGPPLIEPAPRGDAVRALLSRAFNHYRDPEASFRAVVALVREARVWRATYAQAPDLARLLYERLGQSAAATSAR